MSFTMLNIIIGFVISDNHSEKHLFFVTLKAITMIVKIGTSNQFVGHHFDSILQVVKKCYAHTSFLCCCKI